MSSKSKTSFGKKLGHNAFTIIIFVALSAYFIWLAAPLIWTLYNTFKAPWEFTTKGGLGLPEVWTLENYKEMINVFKVPVSVNKKSVDIYIEVMVLYTFIYAIGCAVVMTLVNSLMAYIAAMYNFKFSKVIINIVIVTMILPIVGALPSELQLIRFLGLHNSFLSVFILKANFLGLYFLLFHAAFKSLPKEFSEAAKIDGASNFSRMILISYPLISKMLATILLINFIHFWNDYQTPLIYIPRYPTLSVGLLRVTGTSSHMEVPQKLTACLIVFLPLFIIFLLTQKRLIGNVVSGGIKG